MGKRACVMNISRNESDLCVLSASPGSSFGNQMTTEIFSHGGIDNTSFTKSSGRFPSPHNHVQEPRRLDPHGGPQVDVASFVLACLLSGAGFGPVPRAGLT